MLRGSRVDMYSCLGDREFVRTSWFEGSTASAFLYQDIASWCTGLGVGCYRGTSLKRNTPTVGHYSGPMPRDLWWSQGVGCFF